MIRFTGITFLSLIIVFSLTFCCKKKAERGITIKVVDQITQLPIQNVEVSIHDTEHSDSGPLIDRASTNSAGEVHLKLCEKCHDYLKILSSGDSAHYGNIFQGYDNETSSLPKQITIELQHH